MPRRGNRKLVKHIIEYAQQLCEWYEKNAEAVYKALEWAEQIPNTLAYNTRRKKYYKVAGDNAYIYEYVEVCESTCNPYGPVVRARADKPEGEILETAARIHGVINRGKWDIINGLRTLQLLHSLCRELQDAIIASSEYSNMR